MALINCPACHKQISEKSEFCLHCGHPINIAVTEVENQQSFEFTGHCKCGVDPPKWVLLNKKESQNYFYSTLAIIAGLIGLILLFTSIFGIFNLNDEKVDIKAIIILLLVGFALSRYSYRRLFTNYYKTFKCLNCGRQKVVKSKLLKQD